jgi:AcrR family transcriptional regulator
VNMDSPALSAVYFHEKIVTNRMDDRKSLTSRAAFGKFDRKTKMVERTMISNKDEMVKTSILQAAERVFQKWGLNKTTMEDIAREAGKGKSTLYYYYQSKEEIFHEVVTRQLDFLMAKAKEATLETVSAKEKIKKYIVALMNEIKKYAIVYSIARREIKGNQRLLDEVRKTFQDREESVIREILKNGIRTKEFSFIRKNELDSATKAIVGIIHALVLYIGLENDDLRQIDIAAKLIANGM